MRTLSYSANDPAIRHVATVDPVLGRVIDAVGPYSLTLREDRFVSLARAIVGQQLSVKAAQTIWGRFADLAGELEPATIAGLDDDALRGVGLSRAKAAYVRDLARSVADGSVDLAGLDELSDDEVIAELTRIKGIGRWTAEMFLIFSLGRPDVFAVDDVGLQRAVRMLHGLPESEPLKALAALSESWSPYRTAASLYLWEALDQKLLGE